MGPDTERPFCSDASVWGMHQLTTPRTAKALGGLVVGAGPLSGPPSSYWPRVFLGEEASCRFGSRRSSAVGSFPSSSSRGLLGGAGRVFQQAAEHWFEGLLGGT